MLGLSPLGGASTFTPTPARAAKERGPKLRLARRTPPTTAQAGYPATLFCSWAIAVRDAETSPSVPAMSAGRVAGFEGADQSRPTTVHRCGCAERGGVTSLCAAPPHPAGKGAVREAHRHCVSDSDARMTFYATGAQRARERREWMRDQLETINEGTDGT